MAEVQRDYETPVQRFLTWEASPDTLRLGTLGFANGRGEHYIPRSALDKYLTEQTVRQILKALFQDDHPDAFVVWRDYRCSFAILLSIHQGHMIRQFLEFSSLQDKFLPFPKKPTDFPESSQVDFFSTFYKRQWQFLPLELTYKMRGPVSPDVILPFQVKGRLGRGRSANVDKLEVDEEYNSLGHPMAGSNKTPSYVVKTFHSDGAHKYFDIEKGAYERLNASSKPPPHLVGFHGSFSRHGKYHLILEYADRGTLKDFMEQNQPPSRGEDILDFWRCLLGLLIGLHNLHEVGGQVSSSSFMSGWHQDVKPTNILVKSREGSESIYDSEFMLADLGLCHFKLSNRDENDITDEDTYGTYAYGAPEAHRISQAVNGVPISVSRKVDVWSMGCIYSEVAMWICHSWSRVEQYRSERQKEVARKLSNPEDGDLFHDGATVLDAVKQAHNSIQDSHRISDFITPKLIDVISEMLLDQRVRVHALQAHRKGELAIRAAEKELKGPNGCSSGFGQSPNLLVSTSWGSSEQADLHKAQENPITENGSASPYVKRRASPVAESLPRTLAADGSVLPHLTQRESPVAKPSPHIPIANGSASPDPDQRASPVAEPPPRISVANVLEWKRAGQFYGMNKDLQDAEQLARIKNRDSVFIIDNSATMGSHRSEARRVLEAVSYAVKRYDPDGIDMLCTHGDISVKSTVKTKRLMNAFDELPFHGTTDMEHSLGDKLQEYRSLYPGQNSASAWTKRIKSFLFGGPKPLSLYILTDGAWQPGCKVEAVIRDMVDFLKTHDLRKQVAIQFIRFGNGNQPAIDTLNHLDDGLNLDMDIVDTTPADGNVWKMILGAIHTWFDEDNRPMTA